jgi:DNA-binding LytR/AlgR family response regulator
MTISKKNIPHEIILLKGAENYTYIHLITGEKELSSYTLLRHEEKLKNFIRINRSYLVNPAYIEDYCLDVAIPHVVMACGKKIRIPRRKVRKYKNVIL